MVNDTTLSSDYPLPFRIKFLKKKSISEKIKASNDKTEQNKAQYNLDRKTSKISVLSSRNTSKYEFLTGKDVLAEKHVLEKAAKIKILEYSPLGK